MRLKIFYFICMWSLAAVLFRIGIYVGKRKEPMWFWAGSAVPSEEIKDIPAYNKENKKMWCLSSIPYWILGISYFWYPFASGILMILSGVANIAWIIWCYGKIEKKYRIYK